MKRTVFGTILTIAVLTAAVVSFSGCNNNGNTSETSGSTSAASEQPSETDTQPLAGQWQSEKLPEYVYTFKADGTGQYDMAGNVLNLTYTTEDGKITITFLAEGYTPVTLEYVLEGDRLNIKDSFGTDTFYVKVKNAE